MTKKKSWQKCSPMYYCFLLGLVTMVSKEFLLVVDLFLESLKNVLNFEYGKICIDTNKYESNPPITYLIWFSTYLYRPMSICLVKVFGLVIYHKTHNSATMREGVHSQKYIYDITLWFIYHDVSIKIYPQQGCHSSQKSS